VAQHKDRIKVCFPFSGDAIGGSHISVLGLLAALDPKRYEPIIVPETPDGRIATLFGAYRQIPDPVGNTEQFVPGEAFSVRKYARTFGGVRHRAALLRTREIDIVHVNDGRTSADWGVAARLARVPLIWHNRGDPRALGLRLAAPILADRVLCVSEFALPSRGMWSAAGKAEVVYSPFDTSLTVDRREARAAVGQELGIGPDALVLGFFGAFVERKRPLVFVDLVARLRQMLDRPVLGVMFGEARRPEMHAAVQARIAATGTCDVVKLMGYRDPGVFWMAACDQLVVPAVAEPFGRTLVEAMLVGTPVVAARSGGNIEALRDTLGVLVPPDDVAALARACAELARDPCRAAVLAECAMADARHRFGIAQHCERVTAAYARVLCHP
jgi:glycosyltransferase involved in cell wall biosynthesis